jgi:predicted nucleotidyltransferase
MDLYQDEVLRLVSTFQKNGVKYLIVGGFAINKYGYHRATGDVDFYIKDSLENRKNLVVALDEMGYGNMQELLRLPIIAGYCEIMMDSGMYADLMSELPGLAKEEFDKHYEMALKEEINGIELRFIHYNHLIQNKKATGRAKDMLDVQELERINSRLSPGEGT